MRSVSFILSILLHIGALAFALYVYERQRAGSAAFENDDLADDYNRQMHRFGQSLKIAALALERRSESWTLFNLRDYWDRRAAELILGRPLGVPAVEPVH